MFYKNNKTIPGVWVLIRFFVPGAIIFFYFLSTPLYGYAAPLLENIDRRLENISLEKLAHVQADSDTELAPFTTDGCSGGMSDGWIYLADRFPSFGEQVGTKPPWESCCVAHDRLYWRGETADGYDKRLQADEQLKQCVIGTGRQLSDNLAARLEVTEDQVKDTFTVAAELMYRAVRLGGKPCSRLPWRWGYGWPHCPLFIRDNDDTHQSSNGD